MKVHTTDELSRQLREDLAWRRKENLFFQSIVRGAEAKTKQALLRGAIASLYAHWEGFVKASCRIYLEFVKTRRLQHSKLSIPLLGLALRFRLKKVTNIARADSHREFSDWLFQEWDRRAKLPPADDFIGSSNLNSEIFKSFVNGLGLPYLPDFKLSEKPVIDALVELRNHLAHGGWQIIDESQYDQLYDRINHIMELLCGSIEEAAAQRRYCRKNGQNNDINFNKITNK